jgi:hypothetical protein
VVTRSFDPAIAQILGVAEVIDRVYPLPVAGCQWDRAEFQQRERMNQDDRKATQLRQGDANHRSTSR